MSMAKMSFFSCGLTRASGLFAAAVLALSFAVAPRSAEATVLDLAHPTLPLISESGPFGFGGRGVIFRAEEDFSMSQFGMEGRWDGQLNLGVDVYEVAAPGARALVSSVGYADQTWSGDPFTMLDHSHSFDMGTIYEVVFRFDDPGLIFPHFNFNNPTNNPGNGYMVGTQMLILDGSDYDRSLNQNFWLANFRMNTGNVTPAPVPLPAGLPLLFAGIGALAVLRRKAA